jgi:tetratricopeptide (TPR) repeat protein
MASFTQKEQDQLQEALALCNKGLLKEGKHYLVKLYKNFPDLPSILTPLATILIQEGNFEDGILKLKRSLKIDPKQSSALNNLGNAYIELKRFREAIDSFQEALKISPDFIDAYYNTGRAYSALEDYESALSFYNLTLEKESRHLWAFISQGYCYFKLERYYDALSSYDKALGLDYSIAELHFNKGLVQNALGLYTDAIKSFNYVIRLNPEYKDIYKNLGQTLENTNDAAQAQEVYKYALKYDPNNLEIYTLFFDCYEKLNDDNPNQIYIEDALKISPNFEPALMAKALLLSREGDFEKSSSIYNALINSKSKYSAKCFWQLSRSKKFTDPSDNLIEEIKIFLKDVNLDYKPLLNYALGKIHEDLKLYDEAFIFYEEANRLKLTKNYDINNFIEHIDKIIEQFDINFRDNFLKKITNYQSSSDIPVFIFGMPRSGTSLTEQIISSHPLVKPAGELTFWHTPSLGILESTPKENFIEITERYINLLKKVSHAKSETLRITEKNPHNFLCAGIILALFPKAKFFHCKRYPIDNCWSIFTLPFHESHDYAQNLEYLGKYYLAYQKLMAHWELLFPGRIMNISYEGVINDPEYWSRKLIDHIGLPWNESCLKPHQNKRSVSTFSNWQVRQPIYKSSVRRSDNFEKHLWPLKVILEYENTN